MRKNVILITSDALRFDHISHISKNPFQTKKTTPFLDSLVDEGILLTNHYSTGSGTSTSFPGIHASSLPLDYGYAGLNEQHRSLADVLQSNSVQTIGITAQTSCSSLYNYDRGFDIFQDWVDEDGLSENNPNSFLKRTKEGAAEIIKNTPGIYHVAKKIKDIYNTHYLEPPYHQATEVTDTTLQIIDEHLNSDENYFIWVHYMEPHAPYFPPKDCVDEFHNGNETIRSIQNIYKKTSQVYSPPADGSTKDKMTVRERDALRDFYASSVRYLDKEIKRLFNGLSERGLLDDSILFFSADHGEELFDHGDFGHRPRMYDELINVPLIIHAKDSHISSEEGLILTSHLDLAPTIATLYEIEPAEEWRGQTFIKDGELTERRDHVVAELSHTSGLGGSIDLSLLTATVRTGEWKLIHDRQIQSDELYNVLEDPEERKNVYNDYPKIVAELENILESRLDAVTDQSKEVEISEAATKRLRELGYRE